MSEQGNDKPNDTPRTDAHCKDIGGDDGLCYSEFARQLERELAFEKSQNAAAHRFTGELRRQLEEALVAASAGTAITPPQRPSFEKWLQDEMGLESDKDFAAHLAWKAWQEATRRALQSATEECMADAERYRLIRSKLCNRQSLEFDRFPNVLNLAGMGRIKPSEIDAAVDAMRAAMNATNPVADSRGVK